MDTDLAAEALAAFDRQCSAGDDWSLEYRAMALIVLADWVSAAESMDAFLVAHEEGALPPDLRRRVDANRAMIETHVATLVVRTAPGARVTLSDGRDRSADAPLRVRPGRVDLEVTADGATPVEQSIELTAGERREIVVTLEAVVSEPVIAPAVAPTSTPTQPRLDLMPWVVAGSVAALTFGAAGVITTIWAEDRATTYNSVCAPAPATPGCTSVLSEYDAAHALRIVTFVTAGLLLVGTLVVWFIQQDQPRQP